MSYLILLPDLEDDALRAKLVKGMGHNENLSLGENVPFYGEPAWPNELLHVFPTCILGTIMSCVTLVFLFPVPVGEEADALYLDFCGAPLRQRASEIPVGLLPDTPCQSNLSHYQLVFFNFDALFGRGARAGPLRRGPQQLPELS